MNRLIKYCKLTNQILKLSEVKNSEVSIYEHAVVENRTLEMS